MWASGRQRDGGVHTGSGRQRDGLGVYGAGQSLERAPSRGGRTKARCSGAGDTGLYGGGGGAA